MSAQEQQVFQTFVLNCFLCLTIPMVLVVVFIELREYVEKIIHPCKFGKIPHNMSDWRWGDDRSETACHYRICQRCGFIEQKGNHDHRCEPIESGVTTRQVCTCIVCGESYIGFINNNSGDDDYHY